MPEFVPVRTRVPMELFGDAVLILEFVHTFKSIFDFKQFFPKGFTWGMSKIWFKCVQQSSSITDLDS